MGFTRNYYISAAIILSGIYEESTPSAWKLKEISGSVRTPTLGGNYPFSAAYAFTSSIGGSLNNAGMLLGTGTNAFSLDDYKLQTDVTASFTKAGLTCIGGAVSDALSRTVTWNGSFVNTSGTDITVSEVGLTKRASWASSWYNFLMYREVLATPVTVPAGQGITVTLTFTFDGFNVLANAQVAAN